MEELGEFVLEDLKDCTHGIIVSDPESNDGEMVHWVGYWEQPNKEDFDDLKRELSEDNQFGLVDIAHRLEYRGCNGEDLIKLLIKYII